MSDARRISVARWVFYAAAIYGLPVMLGMLVAPERMLGGAAMPPAEWYYGFATVTTAWQIAFVVIGRDPVRMRPLMPVAVCEKWFYVAVMIPLIVSGRVAPRMITPVAIDAALGAAFVYASAITRGIGRDVTRA